MATSDVADELMSNFGTSDMCRATADLDDEVPLGGLAKLGSNVAGMVAGLEAKAPSLRRISPSRLGPAVAMDLADVQLSPRRKGILKEAGGLQKGNALAAMLAQADRESSFGSTAGLLGSGAFPTSPGASPDRYASCLITDQQLKHAA